MLKKLLSAALLVGSSIAAYANTAAQACDVTAGVNYNPKTPIVKLIIAGSSAMWTTMALGAFNQGNGITGQATKPMHHYTGSKTSSTNFRMTLVDPRPTANSLGGASQTDDGNTWVVWDSYYTYNATTKLFECHPHVWAYVNLDSVIGNRAFFAGQANLQARKGFAPSGSNTISGALWPVAGVASSDDPVPANIQSIFACGGTDTCGPLVTAGATDIDPEDAYYATLRVNSALDTTTPNVLNGLGYNPNNAVGTAPLPCTNSAANGGTPQSTLSQLTGSPILESASEGSGKFAVMSFNLYGNDPYTCNPVQGWTTQSVGAAPIVFVTAVNGNGALAGLQNASEIQLQQVFSGANVTNSAFGLTGSLPIAAFVREPLSGTMNTTEETVFRHPSSLAYFRASQETGVGAVQLPTATAGDFRYRAIGTGDEVGAVQNTATRHGKDGIGYAFFSFGNVGPLAGSANYNYITLNSVDPVYHSYFGGDLAQTGTGWTIGTIPSLTQSGICGGVFPCPEGSIWAPDASLSTVTYSATGVPTVTFDGSLAGHGLSFPNVRNGSYPAWSILRLATASSTEAAKSTSPYYGTYVTALQLIQTSNLYAVTTVPDYVPYAKVTQVIGGVTTTLDPGLQLVRSHFGCPLAGVALCGPTVAGGTTPRTNSNIAAGVGRDAGGSILIFNDVNTNRTQDANGSGGYVFFKP